MSEDQKALSRQQKYKLRQLEFKENNRKSLCIVNLIATIVTIGLAIGTLVILTTDSSSCTASHLRTTLWLMLGMHVINTVESVCGLTGFDRIFCGCICTVGFFVYEVAVLVYMNTVYLNSKECESQTPT
jgi:predicted membrane channel-forming protein YqfA (hemolysin III family)